MPEHTFTLDVPSSLWEAAEKLANAQNCAATQVVQDALEFYLAELIPKPHLSPEEARARLLNRHHKDQARRRLIFERMAAEGKIHLFPKDVPLEQVRRALAGIKGSLAEEIIKEREEGW